jgi:succinyl-CoA synthetase beta subunit
LLASAGIDVVPSELVTTSDDAVAVAQMMGGPVALKVVSRRILHKTDIGGVVLDVVGADAIRSAYRQVTDAAATVKDAEIEGVLISPMRRGGIELLVGVVRDEQWGSVLAVGFGGILVEVLGDSALATLPVTPQRVEAMLRGLRGAPLLDGLRGGKPVNMQLLSDQIARIGNLAFVLGDDLVALEVNPLHVDGDLVEALDAVVEWRQRPTESRLQMDEP